ncbi:transposase domain-containing protein [Verrucomicrobiota bacterium sgz303538]
MFIGESAAGHRSALIFTIIASCRQHGLDPFEYLRSVLGKLPSASTSDIAALTPQHGLVSAPLQQQRHSCHKSSAYDVYDPNIVDPAVPKVGSVKTAPRVAPILLRNQPDNECVHLAVADCVFGSHQCAKLLLNIEDTIRRRHYL